MTVAYGVGAYGVGAYGAGATSPPVDVDPTPPGEPLVAGVPFQRLYTVTVNGVRYERLLAHGGAVTRLRYFPGTNTSATPVVDVGPFTSSDGVEWLSPEATIPAAGTYTPVVTIRVTSDPASVQDDVEAPVTVYSLDGVIDGEVPTDTTAPPWAPTVDDVGEVMHTRGPFTGSSRPNRTQVASFIADTANSLLTEVDVAVLTPLQEATARLFVTFQVASSIEASFFPEQQFGDSISDYYDRRAGAELVRLRSALGLSSGAGSGRRLGRIA